MQDRMMPMVHVRVDGSSPPMGLCGAQGWTILFGRGQAVTCRRCLQANR